MPFTDFPNGLTDATQYLSSQNSLQAELTGSVADIGRLVISAQLDFNLKEIICSLLAGRGLKLPNIQICVSLNLKELLGNIIGQVQQALYDGLAYWNDHRYPYVWKKRPQEQLPILGGFGIHLRSNISAI